MKRASGISPPRRRDAEKSRFREKSLPLRGEFVDKKPDRSDVMRDRIAAVIRSIPRGKVSTYGAIARAAGYAGASRYVAAVLRRSVGMPWQRVLGAGGEIKLRGDSAVEQRLRLEAEGVRFRGKRVDMKHCEYGTKSGKRIAAARKGAEAIVR